MPTLSTVSAGKHIRKLHLVGCGGVASYLLPVLLKTFEVEHLVLHDGDILEERNLDRQLFSSGDVGRNKADALASLLQVQNLSRETRIETRPEYFTDGAMDMDDATLIIGTVDNHAARKAILNIADQVGCPVVFGANEYTDASGMFYRKEWRNSPLDPRVRYTEINTDESDNPLRPLSCQGAAQRTNSQLAMANFGAANHVMWLLWFWLVEQPKLSVEVREAYSPIEHSNNFNRTRTVLNGTALAEATA